MSQQLASLSRNVIVCISSGDRPATITKVLTNTMVEVCAFMPAPVPIERLQLHLSREEAVNAALQSGDWHGYWPAKG